jgi:phosphoglycolate phosphatase
MVGDRHYDIEGAVQTDVDSLGVLYGYGDRRELCRAGASYLAGSPAEAAELIGKM